MNILLNLFCLIIFLLPSLILSDENQKKPPKCGGGDPCIWVDKNVGWELYDPYLESMGQFYPFPPKTDSWNKSTTSLYFTIASFRDKLCPKTLFNLYTKAKYPKRIFSGVVQQNIDGDIDCLEEYCRLMGVAMKLNEDGSCPYKDNIRMDRIHASNSKGPTWARARGSLMLKDEEFCMQTDSHMDFVPNWDIKMMQMWADTKNEYGILSTYVADSIQLDKNLEGGKGLNGLHEVPHLCMVTLNGAYGLVRNWGTKCARSLPKPKLTNAVWGAGLSFSKCHAEKKVMYDPHTPFIFDGEEFSRAARFWTYGYDIYTPNRVFVVHNYVESQSDPTHSAWGANIAKPGDGNAQDSVYRLKTLFQIPHMLRNIDNNNNNNNNNREERISKEETLKLHTSKYGMGDRRSFDQLIKFTGFDTINQKILYNRCGNIQYVPWIEHPFGPDYIPEFDKVTEEFIGVRDPTSVFYDPLLSSKWEQELANYNIKNNNNNVINNNNNNDNVINNNNNNVINNNNNNDNVINKSEEINKEDDEKEKLLAFKMAGVINEEYEYSKKLVLDWEKDIILWEHSAEQIAISFWDSHKSSHVILFVIGSFLGFLILIYILKSYFFVRINKQHANIGLTEIEKEELKFL